MHKQGKVILRWIGVGVAGALGGAMATTALAWAWEEIRRVKDRQPPYRPPPDPDGGHGHGHGRGP